MTEEHWLAATDPLPMLYFLRDGASARKLRLFACACCRRTRELLTQEPSRTAVEVAEAFADGAVDEKTLAEAAAAAEDVYQQINLDRNEPDYPDPVAGEYLEDAAYAAYMACNYCHGNKGNVSYTYHDVEEAAFAALRAVDRDAASRFREQSWQAELVRCVFGNPFRPAPAVAPGWLAWNGGTVPKLAAALYEEFAFERLPLLADALEDAGCPDAALLGHLRGPGPHVRGCWAVDLLLGKE